MKDKEALIRKLAEWAGFIHHPGWAKQWSSPILVKGKGRLTYYKPPNFTESLDACEKWLVPVGNIEYIYFGLSKTRLRCTIQQFDSEEEIWADGETMSMAMALAFEKLIDGEGG